MRKFTYLLALLLILLLAACSSKEEATSNEKKPATEKEKEEQTEQAVEVDKNLLSVEVTIPMSYFEGEDINTVIAEVEKEGVEVTKNGEESVTYRMSKSQHKAMMEDMEKEVLSTIEDIKTSGEYPSIMDVTHNKDFSEFTLVVDKAAYQNSYDGFAVLALGLSGSFYQLYNGANTADLKVTISAKDHTTGEVFDEIVFPDALNEWEEENVE